MASVFTRIINGEIPCHQVAETDRFIAFLDITPLKEGHTLVVPKQEVDYIFDIEHELYAEYMLFAKLVAQAVKRAIPCKKVGVAVIGLEVPHAHIHLIPMNAVDDMNFAKAKLNPSAESLAETAAKIRKAFTI